MLDKPKLIISPFGARVATGLALMALFFFFNYYFFYCSGFCHTLK